VCHATTLTLFYRTSFSCGRSLQLIGGLDTHHWSMDISATRKPNRSGTPCGRHLPVTSSGRAKCVGRRLVDIVSPYSARGWVDRGEHCGEISTLTRIHSTAFVYNWMCRDASWPEIGHPEVDPCRKQIQDPRKLVVHWNQSLPSRKQLVLLVPRLEAQSRASFAGTCATCVFPKDCRLSNTWLNSCHHVRSKTTGVR